MAAMKYRMLGLDLDGTLLAKDGSLSVQNIDALGRAMAAGLRVVPCTGRAWRESRMVLEQLPALDYGVFVGGAMVCEPASGRSIDLAAMEPALALRLIEHLADFPEAVLVYQDVALAGCDYLIAGRGRVTDNTQWWFEITEAVLRECREPTLDDLHHTLRVGLVAPGFRIKPAEAGVAEAFAGQVLVQSFEAVQTPDPMENVHVLEIFAAGVDKWRGLQWVARRHGIRPEQVAVIGDEINDLAMLAAAGCGIAMGNAIEPVKQIADHVTLHCDEHGVAHAIDRLLAGEWG